MDGVKNGHSWYIRDSKPRYAGRLVEIDKLGCHPSLTIPFLLHKLFWEPIAIHPIGQQRFHNVLTAHR